MDCLGWFAMGMLAGGAAAGVLVWRLFEVSLDQCEKTYGEQAAELVAVRSAVLRVREKLEADEPWQVLHDTVTEEVARWAS